jgi:tripartite-type tricarboxylate transporter receptor subunit TctC
MQEYPGKPIRMLTFTAGGSVDFVARLIAQGLSQALGQAVNVENHPELAAIGLAARAPGDGYTLLHFGPQLWTAPLLQKVDYDPVNDLAPVTMAITQPNVLVAHPSLAASSVAELIALAREKPGQIKYGCGINAASSQLAGELFNDLAKVRLAAVPYTATATLAVSDLIAGKIDMMIFGAGSAMKHVKAGKLKILGITSLHRSTLFPDIPTVAATVAGYESVHDEALYVPARTPAGIVDKLHVETAQWLRTDEARRQLAGKGMEAVCSTPPETAAKCRSDMARWKTVMERLGLRERG